MLLDPTGVMGCGTFAAVARLTEAALVTSVAQRPVLLGFRHVLRHEALLVRHRHAVAFPAVLLVMTRNARLLTDPCLDRMLLQPIRLV